MRFDPALFDVGKSDWGSDKLTEVRQMRMGRLASGSDKEDERKERIDLVQNRYSRYYLYCELLSTLVASFGYRILLIFNIIDDV